MRKQNLPIQRILTGDSLVTLAHEMRYPDISSLYAAIGEGHVSAQSVVQKLVQALGGEEAANEDIAETAPPIRPPLQAPLQRRPGRGRQGRRRCVGQAGPLLYAGARRPDHRLRHPRQRRLGAPRRLRQRRLAVPAAGADPRRRVGAHPVLGLPGRHPGRGAGPLPAALGRHPRPVRPARQHPLGGRPDLPRPGRHLPLHLRDGRPEASGACAEGGTGRGGRLRRLPRDLGPQAVG